MSDEFIQDEDTQEVKDEAFRLFQKGYTQNEIAKIVGRDPSRISRWKQRENWEGRKRAIDTTGEDPGVGGNLPAVRDTPMPPEQVSHELALVLSRLIEKANYSLENLDFELKNVYHIKALFETLRLMQEMQRIAAGLATDVKETRHVHVMDGDLREQIEWLKAAVDDGVNDIVIEGEILDQS